MRGYEGGMAGLNWWRRMAWVAERRPTRGRGTARTMAAAPVVRGGPRRGAMIRVSVRGRVGQQGGEVIRV
jgi:hypothetical protein